MATYRTGAEDICPIPIGIFEKKSMLYGGHALKKAVASRPRACMRARAQASMALPRRPVWVASYSELETKFVDNNASV